MRTENMIVLSTEVLQSEALETVVGSSSSLVVHNDDYNTFDHVIETLIELCGHDPQQAEQCAYIIHHTGKCPVKSGSFEALQPVWAELTHRGLTATIEQIVAQRS
jgi:ATP-dependent Clp protease adaptor protein ClpS